MAFTEKEWLALKKRAEQKREAERTQYYKGLAQAEVGASNLTQHAAWNWFLQILAAHKENAERYLAAVEQKLRDSDDFSHEGLARVQATRLTWGSRIRTLEEVMALPAQIVDDAQAAEKTLKALKRAESEEKSDSSAAS